MKIAVIGATGKAGSLIVKEAAARGHDVTAIVRDASKAGDLNVAVIGKSVFDLNADDLKSFDAVVNAFGAAPGREHQHVEGGRALIEALKGAPDTRLIVVGGAGSLFVDEALTTRLLETPEFPKEYYATASNQGQNLEDLRRSTGIRWTFVSPSAFFDPAGKRTGAYRTGGDRLLVNSQGKSYVSYADFAIAIVDEIENPRHANERFTVVSEAE
ncbi:NAD(P)-dependent oxidoreductase [Paenibacillus sp. GYB003]|uniref:NAD(P)-dependent oxidoreductase n=1 Tax=Paenibacillus sp. GYB003 TaxID=2994392 RepID=UPI002F96DB56